MTDPTCRACGRAGTLRPLPWPDDDAPPRFRAAPVCQRCIAPSVGALREIVRRAEIADDGDEVDRVLGLIAFLRGQGHAVAESAAEGMRGAPEITRSLHAVLDSLERQLICSQCWSRRPESRTHVVPYFNNSVGRYVTSFRCDSCVDGALTETMTRVRDVDGANELDSLGCLLRSHGVLVDEWVRGGALDRLRPAMVKVLAALRRPAMQQRLRLRALPDGPPSIA
jgi:hypothetical protein